MGPFDMAACVPCSLLCTLPLKMDAGEMLITAGHEAGRVHSSKAGLGAAEPQSAGLNLFRSEALQLPKADASAETPSYTTPPPPLPEWVGVSVYVRGPMCTYAFVSIVRWNTLVLSGLVLEDTKSLRYCRFESNTLSSLFHFSDCLFLFKAMPPLILHFQNYLQDVCLLSHIFRLFIFGPFIISCNIGSVAQPEWIAMTWCCIELQ